MKYLLLILAVFGSASAIKKQMIESNRVLVPLEKVSTSCEECELVIKKIEEAAKDPKKMEELKLILGMLCKETSYAEECRLFVSQLDRFIDKLVPYFKDPHAICARIHICNNKRIDAFRKVLLDFSTRVSKSNAGPPQIVCDECEFAMKEVKAAVENKELQIEVRDFLRNKICNTLGSYRGFCDLVVDEYLPEFIQQVDAILENPHQVCVDIHACNASPLAKQRKYTYTGEENEKVENEVEEFWSRLQMIGKNGQVLAMSCFECKLTVDSLGEEMISNRKGLSDDVQAFACYKIVPANMTASCIDFLSLYLPTIIQMTIEQFTAEGLCQANKCCPLNSLETYKDFSFHEIQEKKCSTMVELEKYVAENLVSSPVGKFVKNNIMEMFCEKAFRIFAPLCQQIASGIAPRFIKTTAALAGESKFSRAFNC